MLQQAQSQYLLLSIVDIPLRANLKINHKNKGLAQEENNEIMEYSMVDRQFASIICADGTCHLITIKDGRICVALRTDFKGYVWCVQRSEEHHLISIKWAKLFTSKFKLPVCWDG